MINFVRLFLALTVFSCSPSFAIYTHWTPERGAYNWIRDTSWILDTPVKSPSGIVTNTSRSLALTGAKSPVVVNASAKVLNASALLIGAGRILTPVGAVIQLAMLAEQLETSGYTDVTATNTGWTAVKTGSTQITVWTFDNVSTFASAGSACGGLATMLTDVSGGSLDAITGESPNRVANCNGTTTYPNMPPGANNTSFGGIGSVYEIPNPNNGNSASTVSLTDSDLAKILDDAGIPDSAMPALGDALNNGTVTPKLEALTYSGPASVAGKTTTSSKTNSETGEVTTTTTNNVINISYSGPNITTTNQETTTVTKTNPTTNTTSTEVTTTNTDTTPDAGDSSNSEDSSILCSLFPDILACKTLDDPGTEEIPKEIRNIELQTGPQFSGGSCIPNVVVTVFGTQITALDMSQPCVWIETMLKPLILLFASMSAVFIVMPRSD